MEQRMSIRPITLRCQRPTEIKEAFIELFPDHLLYRLDFVADEPNVEDDPESGWKVGVKRNYEIVARKENVAGVEKYLTDDGKWGIKISVDGFNNDLKMFFKTEEPAIRLFEKLYSWLYPNK